MSPCPAFWRCMDMTVSSSSEKRRWRMEKNRGRKPLIISAWSSTKTQLSPMNLPSKDSPCSSMTSSFGAAAGSPLRRCPDLSTGRLRIGSVDEREAGNQPTRLTDIMPLPAGMNIWSLNIVTCSEPVWLESSISRTGQRFSICDLVLKSGQLLADVSDYPVADAGLRSCRRPAMISEQRLWSG